MAQHMKYAHVRESIRMSIVPYPTISPYALREYWCNQTREKK